METRWLREVLGWRRPVCVTGVIRGANSKPDLVIHLDAASEHCLVNEHAEAAIAKLSTWELRKVKNELPEKVRGAVVLVYSPTIAMTMDTPETSSDYLNLQEQPSAGKMSLDDAAVALAYQHMKDPPRPVKRFDMDQMTDDQMTELREMMERHGFGHDVEGLGNERA